MSFSINVYSPLATSNLQEYRLVNLPSGLEVLLVSTAKLVTSKSQPLESAKAAAAMCVQVGSFADPGEAEGMCVPALHGR